MAYDDIRALVSQATQLLADADDAEARIQSLGLQLTAAVDTGNRLRGELELATTSITRLVNENERLAAELAACQGSGGGDPEPEPGSKIAPPAGKVLVGASIPNGLNAYLGLSPAPAHPHIVHSYATSSSTFSTRINSTPSGSIPLINFKPLNAMGGTAYADINAGRADAAIDAAAQAAKLYGRPLLVGPLHEPENDDEVGTHDAAYAKAFRRIAERMKAIAPNVEIVWNMMGFSNWNKRYDTLYPGSDVVDWIGQDPYSHASARDTWGEVVNSPLPAANWTGFYDWAKKHGKPHILCEYGVDFDVADDVAPQLFSAAQLETLIRDYPLVKALVYWDQTKGESNYRLTNPGTQRVYGTWTRLPQVTIDVSSIAKP